MSIESGFVDTHREYIRKRTVVEPFSGCWLWQGTIMRGRSGGYGRTSKAKGMHSLAHRASYEAFVAPIPEGHHIDHLCERRDCVNPEHLEPVLPEVNTVRGRGFAGLNARKTHCKRGHEFTPENTRIGPQSNGRPGVARWCKACNKLDAEKNRGNRMRGDCVECSWFGRRVLNSECPCPRCGADVVVQTRIGMAS